MRPRPRGRQPVSAPGSASAGAIASIAFGFGGGCLRRPDGSVECWPGSFSNIGPGTQAKTKPVGELGGKAVAIAVGDDACALREDGVVVCWRMDEYNPLVAARVPLPAAAVGITAGSGASCERLSSGIACYGDVFKSHVCAWTGAGDLYCWGGNQYGQLGDGTIASRTDAVKATAPGGPVLSAATGNRQTCALLAADRRLVCWGWNGAGELGAGTGGPRATATAVALP